MTKKEAFKKELIDLFKKFDIVREKEEETGRIVVNIHKGMPGKIEKTIYI